MGLLLPYGSFSTEGWQGNFQEGKDLLVNAYESHLVRQAAVTGRVCQEQPHHVGVAMVTGQHEGR